MLRPLSVCLCASVRPPHSLSCAVTWSLADTCSSPLLRLSILRFVLLCSVSPIDLCPGEVMLTNGCTSQKRRVIMLSLLYLKHLFEVSCVPPLHLPRAKCRGFSGAD